MVWTMATFIGFTILVAVISYVKTKGDDQSTADGYFLAGRGLPGFVIAGSLLLTNLSAEQLVGTNGQTWSVGMSPMAFEIVAAPCCIVLALFAAPRYLKSGITTIPELIGLRYDRSTKLWFSIAYILLYIVVQIPVILYSGSLVFENIFNVSGILGVTKFQAVIILCIIICVSDRKPFGYAQLYRSGGFSAACGSVADRIYRSVLPRSAVLVYAPVVYSACTCCKKPQRKHRRAHSTARFLKLLVLCTLRCRALSRMRCLSCRAIRYP